ncbi:hypothetical protein R1sor_009298 [Riccia sorocarpa]|uniref:Uncharacterized protein n=1 Tax=Riccia sorocarpa TaxID=122646 RepID=A0ABD3HUP9_9MARC
MAPKAPKRRRDSLGPEGPPVRVPRAANRGGGRGPGAPDPVPGPDPVPERPRRRRRCQENIPDWVRLDSPEGVDGEDVGRVAVEVIVALRAHRHRPHVQQWRDGSCVAVLLRLLLILLLCNNLPEGDFLVKWTTVENKVRYIRWGAVSTEDLHEAIASIEDWELLESDLDRALRRSMHKPHLASCMEFIYSFDGMKGTVRGEVIRIDSELICAVFGIPHGMDPLSSVIHHGHVRDWMPIRDDVGKRYLAHQCAYLGWPPVLQAVSMVIMAGRRACCVSTQLLMYLQARFGTGGQKRTIMYNIASFITGSISRETEWVKDHLTETHPHRFCETFVGIPLKLIFLHCGVITEAECETGFEISETEEYIV